MSDYTVHVSNLSATTTEETLKNFFSFCGSIKSVDHSGTAATIHFEKPSSVKTAVMLNGGTLDGSAIAVTADADHPDAHDGPSDGTTIDQADKPRAAVVAEILAKGYKLTDDILQRAIEVDKQRGISQRFIAYLQNLDKTLGAKAVGPEKTLSGKALETAQAATQQAKAIDEQKGISKAAGSYYERALASPLGQKVFAFYTQASKQVLDIHEEAKRIHAEHKAAAPAPAGGEAAPAATPAAPAAAEPKV
ncbi:uncharacterized protein SCHCODRAFT_02614629 [Schizophyllum commune H4-8]|uniref:RRM domain-containing protein n=1 Tax=Schizophyllum commune (strain H4-8 / FGSC 9210) TaxID=578458 RepID=D8PZG8_SCHCM|nr:uncharacterized protein SCHCODRAFT_02614629 [Schizophyllum commune H4-8]KAI5896368.1 hypothetical protein SCHCODRAFT_02614629 [Schizophyllum commune H4-8]